MPRFRHAFGLVAMIGVASVGCKLDGPEQCCPTDARRIAYSCAGQEAVRKGPCGPNEAYYGHHPTCWDAWPQGWEQYKSDYCTTTAALVDCDCEQEATTEAAPVEIDPTPLEAEPVEAKPLNAEPAETVPAIDRSWPEAPLPEPTIEPVKPRLISPPGPKPEPIQPITPAPITSPPPRQSTAFPAAAATTAPSPPPVRFEPPSGPPTASKSKALPTYEDLLRKRPVRNSARPVFGPPPAPDSVRQY